MAALQAIRRAGFSVVLEGEGLQVSPASELTPQQRAFIQRHRTSIAQELKAETQPPPLSQAHRQRLLDYMAAIGETDPEMISELLEECGKDAGALARVLKWCARYQENPHGPH